MENESERMKCDECGAEFVPPDGGVCILCLRPYCKRHLAPPKGDIGPLCRSCGGEREG